MTAPNRRFVVLRASRDTVILTVSTIAVTLALASAVRQRSAQPAAPPLAAEQQEWAGQLAELAPQPAALPSAEPLTSASLTVPKAALALPPMPATSSAPAALASRSARTVTCEGQACAPRSAAPLPPPRQRASDGDIGRQVTARSGKVRDHSFGLADLNPLPHLPDAVRKPFSYAGAKISGWIDRL